MNNDRTNVCSTVCTKDWKKIARASGLSIPAAALDRIAQSLDALEADFRPLARALPPDTEPAIVFHAATLTAGEDAE
ncbi:MAG TPA: hypothetical protein VMQ86_05785 [Bryobacteraceae bacterium]|jgi:hypothetical protein|nr:hypothetical protein [Bryobacteraceae bacterium]